jgi:hypothetical protein
MCEHCAAVATALHGAETAIEAESETKVEEITDAAVEIARIEANRDISLAKINRGLEEKIAEESAAAELVEAETKAEVLETVVETLAPDPEPVPAPAPVTVVNDNEPAPELAPPPAEEKPEHHETRKRGLGMW